MLAVSLSSLLLLLVVASATPLSSNQTLKNSNSSNDCCPDSNVSDVEPSQCDDGTKIRLTCPVGFYQVDDNDTLYHHVVFNSDDTNGSYSLQAASDNNAIKEGYCTGKQPDSERAFAFICFDTDEPKFQYVYGCVNVISVFFLTLTLVVYALLPELRDLQDKTMIAAVTSLTLGYVALAFEQFRPYVDLHSDPICIPLAFTMYYTFLAAFFWLNLVAFNVCRVIWFKSFHMKDSTLFAIFCAIGFGSPGVLLLWIIALHHSQDVFLRPGFGEYTCWFSGSAETWFFFYGPVAILLSLNVLYFTLTCYRLWHKSRDCDESKLQTLRHKCLFYVKLFLVMGITWISELLSFAYGPSDYWIPLDLLNGLQGFVIFLLLVVTRNRVRRLLVTKKFCGFGLPNSWRRTRKDEEYDVTSPEELELSQSR